MLNKSRAMFTALWVRHLNLLYGPQGSDLPQSVFAIERDHGFDLTSLSNETIFGLGHTLLQIQCE
jgi:hypothetical protein